MGLGLSLGLGLKFGFKFGFRFGFGFGLALVLGQKKKEHSHHLVEVLARRAEKANGAHYAARCHRVYYASLGILKSQYPSIFTHIKPQSEDFSECVPARTMRLAATASITHLFFLMAPKCFFFNGAPAGGTSAFSEPLF